MTVTTLNTKVSYTGDGVTTSFPTTFQFIANSHVKPYLADILQTSGFTVTGAGNPAGGSVIFATAPESGVAVDVARVLPLTQEVNTQSNETILQTVFDTALDRATMQIQQLEAGVDERFDTDEAKLNRAILVPDGEIGPIIPSETDRASKVFAFNALGQPLMRDTTPVSVGQPDPDTVGPVELVAGTAVLTFANRAALRAFTPQSQKAAVIYNEGGRNGLFVWSSSNLSAAVTDDPQQGIYVPPSTDTSGASGAWVRQNFTPGEYMPEWFGAVRGGANDYTALAATISYMKSATAGTTGAMALHGSYRTDTGLALDSPLLAIVGKAGCRGASLYSPAANFNLITMSASQCELRNLTIYNNVRSTTQSALVKMVPGAVKCTLDSVDFTGGYHCLWASGYLTDTKIENCSLAYAIGGAMCNLAGCGALTFRRVLMNQSWPVSQPAAGGSQDGGSWGAGQSYAVGVFVRTGGFFLQCKTNVGVTAGTAPVLTGKWYFEDITDGGHTWRIANNSSSSALLIDSACTYLRFFDCDFTGSFAQGVLTANNFGTTAPHLVSFYTCTTAGTVDAGFVFAAGKTVFALDCEAQVLCGAGSLVAGFYVGPSFTGNARIKACKSRDGVKVGVRLGNATAGRVWVTDSDLIGTTYGGLADAGVSNFRFMRNNFSADGSASPTSIRVATGASDYYVIEQNDLVGSSAISDAGTGVNKRVQAGAY